MTGSGTTMVGMVGLGVLGSAIARNVLDGGFGLVGYDRDPARLDELAERGMEVAASVQDVAARSRHVLTCLPTAAALHAVVAEIRRAAGPEHVVVELSTMPIADKEQVRDALLATGASVLDCPVSGNRILALRGELTAFASGERADFDRVEALLLSFCRKAHFIGAYGQGSTMKFVGNVLNLVHNSVAAEAMVLAIKSGLDPAVVHKVISGSGSSSSMFETRGAMMAANDYRRDGMNFSVPLKDARTITEHAATLLCPMPIYHAALQHYYAAVAQGHHDEDAAAVCAAMERAANCERTPTKNTVHPATVEGGSP